MKKPSQTLVMVAPNGARKTKNDHPALPVTIPEIVETARACHMAGADAIHAHTRDGDGHHVLDAGYSREMLVELSRVVPELEVQITTEAVGRYSPDEQRQLVTEVMPKAVSVALKEMTSDDNVAAQRKFYFDAVEANIKVQHILYTPDDVIQLGVFVAEGRIPDKDLSMLFVLGQYATGKPGLPEDLKEFLSTLKTSDLADGARFMVCAFGQMEQACLFAAAKAGGDCRVGFENNHLRPDGTPAIDNAAQVASLRAVLNKS
jgi:uncharacterized protein (DUF849 family)